MVKYDDAKIDKALVSLAIEKSLLELNTMTLEEVEGRLYSKHHVYFSDSLEHPEFLSDILKEIFGNAYPAIIDSIRKNLKDHTYKKSIEEFLVTM